MNDTIKAAADALDNLGGRILATYNDDRPLNEIWGWNLPSLNRVELASYPTDLAARLRSLPEKELPQGLLDAAAKIPARINILLGNSIGNLGSSNAIHVVPQVLELVDYIDKLIPAPIPSPVSVDWKEVGAKGLLPKELLTRLRSLEASLKAIEPRTAKLKEQVEAIEAAHTAAESLPTDLATLEEAREQVNTALGEVNNVLAEVREHQKAVEKANDTIKEQAKEATQLVENCGEAYRITTTKGLAASFDAKAKALSRSLWLWVAGLLGALAVGALPSRGCAD